MWNSRAKRLVRHAIGTPLVSERLRWFLHQENVPAGLRALVHQKLAKPALFGARTFKFRTHEKLLELAHTGTPNYLYWLGAYEPETLGVFTQLARTASVIFDIGAAEGLYSIFAAATNPAARIHAFEPFANAANAATRNFGLNGEVCRNVELHRMALGAEDGVATLYVASESGGNSSLNPAFRAGHGEQPTDVRRGDSFVAAEGIERLDLLKIDTESTEPNVLRGLNASLERHHPHIVCEVLAGRTEAELMELLAPLGYRFWSITSNGLERREQIVGDSRFFNYLFTTADEQSLAARGLPIGR
jgi:FkbM family methyltransferase